MKIAKTIKLFIDGAFPRTESGRSFVQKVHGGSKDYANLCLASRKDLRAAVEAAIKGQGAWLKASGYLKSQIIYRMAEMTEAKRAEFATLFSAILGLTPEAADKQVDEAIDTFIHYAGFCDKFQQLLGTINPVAGPHHNFTTPEAVGVVGILESDSFNFASLVRHLCSALCTGNSVVLLLGKACPSVLAPLAEVFVTSDLPAGVVNLLTGDLRELAPHFATHMEIRSLAFYNEDSALFTDIQRTCTDNMKRLVREPKSAQNSLRQLSDFVEYKTVWHPIGV